MYLFVALAIGQKPHTADFIKREVHLISLECRGALSMEQGAEGMYLIYLQSAVNHDF